MIQAVFFDCDGTILSHKTNSVPQSTKTAFEELKKKGSLLLTQPFDTELAEDDSHGN